MRRITVTALAAAVLGLTTGCGHTSVPTVDDSSAVLENASPSAGAAAGVDGSSQAQPGSFTTGSASITTPAGQATFDCSEGLYVGANGSVVANFADGASNDPSTNALGVSGSPGGLTVTLIGPLQRQGVTPNAPSVPPDSSRPGSKERSSA